MKHEHCCHEEEPQTSMDGDHCHASNRFDFIFWGSLSFVLPLYLAFLIIDIIHPTAESGILLYISRMSQYTFELINTMWWGIALGIIFIGLLGKVPREIIVSILGNKRNFSGIFRATLAGVFIDMCSHGILLVGSKLYERCASLGQMMAFLIASPWNSFSLTLILWALIGFKWTITFLLLSLLIALVSGLIFEWLVKKGVLPDNPHRIELPPDYSLKAELKKLFSGFALSGTNIRGVIATGMREAKMLLRWLLLGVVIAVLIRTFVAQEHFHDFFGPTIFGLVMTVIAATIIEVCSEGTVPVAADILNRAGAPGNSFAFLMTGVSTDYTEIMILKETTKSWKIAFFLPLVTTPQIILLAWIINTFAN